MATVHLGESRYPGGVCDFGTSIEPSSLILIGDSGWNDYHIHSEPTMRVLVIEDDRKMATLLREALEKQLHRTVLAFNGIEGCSKPSVRSHYPGRDASWNGRV
jgi:hypothetical protein